MSSAYYPYYAAPATGGSSSGVIAVLAVLVILIIAAVVYIYTARRMACTTNADCTRPLFRGCASLVPGAAGTCAWSGLAKVCAVDADCASQATNKVCTPAPGGAFNVCAASGLPAGSNIAGGPLQGPPTTIGT